VYSVKDRVLSFGVCGVCVPVPGPVVIPFVRGGRAVLTAAARSSIGDAPTGSISGVFDTTGVIVFLWVVNDSRRRVTKVCRIIRH
jgi:hypothetical protein